MSFSLHGIGVSGGIAIGYAHLTSNARVEVPQYMLDRKYIEEELARFDEAILATRAELETLRNHIPANAPAELVGLSRHAPDVPRRFDDRRGTQAPDPRNPVQRRMGAGAANGSPGGALRGNRRRLSAQPPGRRGAGGAARAEGADRPPQPSAAGCRLRTSSVSWSRTSCRRPTWSCSRTCHFAAFITDLGGSTSHTAILARSMAIPSVMALHNARGLVRDHDLLIVDGRDGVVIVNPDESVLAEYRLRQNQWRIDTDKLKRLKTSKSSTLDGTPIELMANIELLERCRRGKGCGRARHRPVPQRIPVPQPQRPAERRRAIRILQGGGRGAGRQAGHHPHARSGRGQAGAMGPQRGRQSGAGPARHPLVPGRAADCFIPSCARFCARRITARCAS